MKPHYLTPLDTELGITDSFSFFDIAGHSKQSSDAGVNSVLGLEANFETLPTSFSAPGTLPVPALEMVVAGPPIAVFELSSLDPSNGGDGSLGFLLDGKLGAGRSVSAAGDVNGDGYADIIISAPSANSNGASSGESYIVFGGAAPFAGYIDMEALNGNNGFIIKGVDAFDYSGRSVSSAGDINGDGFDDIIIGVEYGNPNGSYSGESYVVFGSDAPFAASLELSALDGSNGFVINGESTFDRSGHSVSSAGDINGDGFDDILIGAKFRDTGGYAYNSGASYVVFGTDTSFSSSFELSTLNGSNGFVINGVSAEDNSGSSVSSAGDVNGDGFDDLIIGADHADPFGGSYNGASYVVFGSSAPFAPSFDLSALNGSNGFAIYGIDGADQAGASVSSAGDFNGDGFDDIIIGAPGDSSEGNTTSESYLVFGSAAPFAASLNLSALNGSNGFVINGVAASDSSGISVSSAGDINGDGFDDLIIGANGVDTNGTSSGASYIVFGSDAAFSASFDLSSINGTNGFVINGVAQFDGTGRSVSAAGDIDGDGYDDIVIGAPSGGPSDFGVSYVIFGSESFGRTVELLTVGDDTYVASGSAELIHALEGNDNVTGTSGSDVIYGQAGNDTLLGEDGNDVLDGGDGIDIINGGAGQDRLIGSAGADNFDGGADIDSVDYHASSSRVILDLSTGGTAGDAAGDSFANIENIQGTGFNDILTGSALDNVISGGLGNDRLDGGLGDDSLLGGAGADTLLGGSGADVMDGSDGFDSVDYRGAASAVRFNVDTGGTLGDAAGDNFSGIERYYLSNFNDVVTGSDANEFFYGEDGNDTINAGGGIDRIYGGAGNDIQRGQDGNDLLFGSSGSDQLNGGTGFDIASYEFAASAVSVDLASGGTAGDAAGDTYFGIEVVRGSDFNDTIIGNSASNELRGGEGNDSLSGGLGNDRLFGDGGADALNGGGGADIAMYTVSSSGVTLDLAAGGTAGDAAGDSFTSIEWVFGSGFDDNITGDSANNRLEGNDGNDVLNGAAGNDRLLGGSGDDTINGGDGVDTIFGQGGNDMLFGGNDNDFFFGSAGGDSMDGGADFDTVSYLASSSTVTVNLQSGGTGGDAAGDSYISIERVFGTNLGDSITGDSGNNVLFGYGGQDYLEGGEGDDSLFGGANRDEYGYNTTNGDNDFIGGFSTNGEVVIILGGDTDFDSFAEIMAVGSDIGSNAVFDFGGGNTLTLLGLSLTDLDANDFAFGSSGPMQTPRDVDAFNQLPVSNDEIFDHHTSSMFDVGFNLSELG